MIYAQNTSVHTVLVYCKYNYPFNSDIYVDVRINNPTRCGPWSSSRLSTDIIGQQQRHNAPTNGRNPHPFYVPG